jgi:hypothetical protein
MSLYAVASLLRGHGDNSSDGHLPFFQVAYKALGLLRMMSPPIRPVRLPAGSSELPPLAFAPPQSQQTASVSIRGRRTTRDTDRWGWLL